MHTITIIGADRLGLITGAVLNPELNIRILDRDSNIINKLKQNEMLYKEPELSELLAAANVEYNTTNTDWILDTDVLFLTVAETEIEQILEQVKKAGKSFPIILESMVPIQYCDTLASHYDLPILYLALNTTEGLAIKEFRAKKNIAIGKSAVSKQEDVLELCKQLFDTESSQKKYTVVTNRTAVLSRLAINEYLAMHIGLANELNQICHAADISYSQLQTIVSMDYRIHPTYMLPGPGFGGIGLTTASKSLAAQYTELVPKWIETHNRPRGIISALPDVNTAITGCAYFWMSQIISKHSDCKTIGVLGLTHKETSESIQESRFFDVLKVYESEIETSVNRPNILVYDENIEAQALSDHKLLEFATFEQIIQKSDVLIINHAKYVQGIKDAMAKVVIDFTGTVKPEVRKELYSWVA